MKINAILQRKESHFDTTECEIEKVIELPAAEFTAFKCGLLSDQDFIADSLDLLRIDSDGTAHCLMVVGEGSDDAVVVESEGFSYARYAGYVAGGRAMLEREISRLADKMLLDAAANSEDGSWIIGFDDVKERFDMTVTRENGMLPMLIEELSERDEVSECTSSADGCSEDCIEMTVMLAHNQDASFTDLMSVIGCNLYDVHLIHSDEEHDLATIDELTPDTLTEQGKTDWKDVLGAKVERIFDGFYGLSIELSGVKPDRLDSFSKMLAGYCSEEDYEKWVAPPSGQSEAPEQSM